MRAGHENSIAQPKVDRCPGSTSHFSPFIRCLSVVLWLEQGRITPKILMLCFVLIDSVLLNRSYVWIVSIRLQNVEAGLYAEEEVNK